DSGVPSANSELWSLDAGVYQLKVGLAFLELAELDSSGQFSRTAEGLLQWSLRRHEIFLPGCDAQDQVAGRLHAYCYFLEGLLPFVEKQFECALALQTSIARVESLIAETAPVLERCDTVAQLLRLRLIGDYMGLVEIDLGAASREVERVASFQLQTEDP